MSNEAQGKVPNFTFGKNRKRLLFTGGVELDLRR